jgi:hypothetical protein
LCTLYKRLNAGFADIVKLLPYSLKRSRFTWGPQRQTPLSILSRRLSVQHISLDICGWGWSSSLTQMQVTSVLEVHCHKYSKARTAISCQEVRITVWPEGNYWLLTRHCKTSTTTSTAKNFAYEQITQP